MSSRESSQRWRDANPGAQYAANKKWRLAHPDTRHAGKARNYDQTSHAPNSHQQWTRAEDDLVLAHSIPDRELAAEIGRSVRAIQTRRALIRQRADLPPRRH